jgi:hypothetical protein
VICGAFVRVILKAEESVIVERAEASLVCCLVFSVDERDVAGKRRGGQHSKIRNDG